jgi:hypothetical protein
MTQDTRRKGRPRRNTAKHHAEAVHSRKTSKPDRSTTIMPTTTVQWRAYDRTPGRTVASGRRAKATRTTPPGPAGDEWLTVDEFCAELKIGRRTFERWRSQGIAPRADRPTRNGPLRMKRSWVDQWVASRA